MCIQNFIKLLKINKGYKLNDLISTGNNLIDHGDDDTFYLTTDKLQFQFFKRV
jgi:hypothetical protein